MNKELKYNIVFAILLILVGETWDLSMEFVYNSLDGDLFDIRSVQILYFFTFNIAYFSVYIFNYLYFAPKYLKASKVPHFVLSVIVMIIIFMVVRFFLEEIVAYHLFGVHNYNFNKENIVVIYLADNIIYALRPCLFSSLFYLFFRFNQNKTLLHKLELKHQEAQMAILRSQIGPHFLFNTLNGFYSELYDEKPETAGDILKLSNLLRYVTYEVNGNFTSLKKEVDFIKSYLYFYEKRYESDFYINFVVKGNIEKKKIPSLILIHFIENVCKHGIIDDEETPAYIDIEVTEEFLIVSTKNKINTSEKYMNKGIGTENIKKRLELLFEDDYELSYKRGDGLFYTFLKIPV